jgi:hypothetical protein
MCDKIISDHYITILVHIAYYKFGNVENPVGIIHDNDGLPLLQKDDILLMTTNDVRCSILKTRNPQTWSALFSKNIFKDTCLGRLYRTNYRLVYVREPSYKSHINGVVGFGLSDAVDVALLSKEWQRTNKRECCSIPVDEIIKLKRVGRRKVLLFVADSGGRYKVQLSSKNEIRI